jgi:uncharacterized protein YqfA (UPF0365 family)
MSENAFHCFLMFYLAVFLLFAIIGGVFFFLIPRPWLRAWSSGAPVTALSIVGMRLRGNPPILLIDAYIALKRAGVETSIREIEGTYIDHRTRVRNRDELIELVRSKTPTTTGA